MLRARSLAPPAREPSSRDGTPQRRPRPPGLWRPSAWLRRCSLRLSPLAVLSVLVPGGCSAGVLDPASPEAELIAIIAWFMFAVSGAIFGLVLALLAWALIRGRRAREAGGSGVGLVLLGGVALPLVVLPVLWFISLPAMADLVGGGEAADLEIEITGYQFHYEVRYAGSEAVVRDELHLPVDERALLRLTSGDVIHSFWIPELGGKRDMLPGSIHELAVRPTREGTYRARCAEFCGVGHAAMEMPVVVEPRPAFEAWIARQAADGVPAP